MQYQSVKLNGLKAAVTFLLVVIIFSLAGCATPEKTKKEEPEDLVWPPPPEAPRIRYLRSYQGQEDFSIQDDFRSRLLGVEKAGITLQKPYGVALNADGSRMYVTDSKWKGVIVFDFKAERVFRFATDAMGTLKAPVEVRLDSQEKIYVTDGYGGKINVYSKEGETLLSLGGEEGVKRPTGLAIDEERNRLYASDTPNHRIVVYDLDGNFIQEIGSRGSDPGELNFPINLALDRGGNLFVTDTGNFRVQIFSPEGEFVREFGQLGDAYGSFARPKGIGVSSENHVYVLDAAFNNFQIFTDEGRLLLFVGTLGRQPGMFWLPTGLFIDQQDKIYVVDSVNRRVQVFQYLKEEAEEEKKP
jgi:DNA-binding beta-propeller fold protein YncE